MGTIERPELKEIYDRNLNDYCNRFQIVPEYVNEQSKYFIKKNAELELKFNNIWEALKL